MSLFRSGTGRWRIPVRVPDPGPRDVLPVDEEIVTEYRARTEHAVFLAECALAAQGLLYAEDRDVELVNLCLELRSALRPSAPGSEVLREIPSPAVRYAVPVIPGRAS